MSAEKASEETNTLTPKAQDEEGTHIPQSENQTQLSHTTKVSHATPLVNTNTMNEASDTHKTEELTNLIPQACLSFFSSPQLTTTTTTSESPSLSSLSTSSQLTDLLQAHKQRQSELHAAGQQAANAEVAAAFQREKQIETELKEVAARSAQLQKHMAAWAGLFAKLNVELKEMGDVANWARRTEEDLAATVHVLEELSERKRRALGMQ
ncbi:Biogenesis of lysosome-related organelles complex 1 subunit 1 [Trypanosoma melophagium]|uniref:Biogenesis of lysosome-related organelles complex 1 subunit 1 n=1 Tax=Trypanosoma melophagium TaxID=715481 RepID=UPI003519ED57|nr:Biogenesis of lysosome-related organelles complex 1 subunit 1 [Trypanosoma melophagium]